VNVGTITSSPGPMPHAVIARCSATVPLATEVACGAPMKSRKDDSNRSTNSPFDEIQVESRHCST
jgi:hypothetical protein